MDEELDITASNLKAATNDAFHHLVGWSRVQGRAAALLLKV